MKLPFVIAIFLSAALEATSYPASPSRSPASRHLAATSYSSVSKYSSHTSYSSPPGYSTPPTYSSPSSYSSPPSYSAAIAAKRSRPALDHQEFRDEFGQYELRYVTAEGTIVWESGRLVPTDQGSVMVVEGETTYVGEDGKIYVTKYSAGLDGNHVKGAHLPEHIVV